MYKGNGNVLTNGQNLSVLLWVPSTTSGERKPEETRSHTSGGAGEKEPAARRFSDSLKFVSNQLEFAAESCRNCSLFRRLGKLCFLYGKEQVALVLVVC